MTKQTSAIAKAAAPRSTTFATTIKGLGSISGARQINPVSSSKIVDDTSANQKVAFMDITVLCLNCPTLYRTTMTAVRGSTADLIVRQKCAAIGRFSQ
jgi:hypothetical protein